MSFLIPKLLWYQIYDVIGVGEWQTVYAMLRYFSVTLQTEILSTVILVFFFKQTIILKSFHFVLSVFCQNYFHAQVQYPWPPDSGPVCSNHFLH